MTVERPRHPQTAPEFRVAIPSRRATGQPARAQPERSGVAEHGREMKAGKCLLWQALVWARA